MTSFSESRKGWIGDVIVVPIFLLFLGVTIILCAKITNDYNAQVQADPIIPSQAKDYSSTNNTRFPSTWDYYWGLIFVTLSIALIISAYLIDTSPVLFPLFIIILAIFVFVSAVISNTYYDFATAQDIAVFAQQFRIINYVSLHWPFYLAIEGPLVLIALFAKITRN